MNRERLQSLIVDYVYGDLEPAAVDRFERALDEHPDIAAEVEAHRRTRQLFSNLPDEAIPTPIIDGIMAQVREIASRSNPKPGFWARLGAFLAQPGYAAAAVAGVVVGVGLLVWERDTAAPTQLASPQHAAPTAAAPPRTAGAAATKDEGAGAIAPSQAELAFVHDQQLEGALPARLDLARVEGHPPAAGAERDPASARKESSEKLADTTHLEPEALWDRCGRAIDSGDYQQADKLLEQLAELGVDRKRLRRVRARLEASRSAERARAASPTKPSADAVAPPPSVKPPADKASTFE